MNVNNSRMFSIYRVGSFFSKYKGAILGLFTVCDPSAFETKELEIQLYAEVVFGFVFPYAGMAQENSGCA